MSIRRKLRVSVSMRMFFTSCGAMLLLLPASRAAAQAPAGPLPSAQNSSQAPTEAGAQLPVQTAARPNLAGTWKLNKDQSDDPREKMQQAMGNSQGQGGGWGGTGGGVHRGGGGGARGRGQGGGMMNEMSQLTIEQTDSTAKVSGASGRVLGLYSSTDQGNAKPSGSDAERSTPPTAQWQGNQLVVVQEGMGGGTTTRTYELSPDGKQLYLTTKMESERFKQPVTYRFVYDRVKRDGSSNQ